MPSWYLQTRCLRRQALLRHGNKVESILHEVRCSWSQYATVRCQEHGANGAVGLCQHVGKAM